jgi:hypothetical protein
MLCLNIVYELVLICIVVSYVRVYPSCRQAHQTCDCCHSAVGHTAAQASSLSPQLPLTLEFSQTKLKFVYRVSRDLWNCISAIRRLYAALRRTAFCVLCTVKAQCGHVCAPDMSKLLNGFVAVAVTRRDTRQSLPVGRTLHEVQVKHVS